MGLDVYAGPLTRYHAGNWKTIVQQMGEAQGLLVHVVRLADPGQPAGPEETQAAVIAWQRGLRAATGIDGLDWPESAALPYFTDKPDWDGYWAVVLWAAADQFPDVSAPAELGRGSALGDPTRLPLVKRSDEVYLGKPAGGLIGRLFGKTAEPPPVESRYPHILMRPELWLPADFPRPFQERDLVGGRYWMGSSPRLLDELRTLNARTFRADDATIDAWAKEGPSQDDLRLERTARFGLAVFLQAARYSVEHRAPVKLDY